MSAREQPLFIEFSTMGTIRESVFDNEYEYGSNILDEKIKDETVLPIIYELDNVDEWQNEVAWYKANPRTWYD
jgi:phage terminase large subunit-like protein